MVFLKVVQMNGSLTIQMMHHIEMNYRLAYDERKGQ
jgi:hypothetical protein